MWCRRLFELHSTELPTISYPNTLWRGDIGPNQASIFPGKNVTEGERGRFLFLGLTNVLLHHYYSHYQRMPLIRVEKKKKNIDGSSFQFLNSRLYWLVSLDDGISPDLFFPYPAIFLSLSLSLHFSDCIDKPFGIVPSLNWYWASMPTHRLWGLVSVNVRDGSSDWTERKRSLLRRWRRLAK